MRNMISTSLPPLPDKIKGVIFTEIIPQFLSEVNPTKLVELGAIVRKKDRIKMYEPLTDSLRKIQWVKLCGLKAIATEEKIASTMEPKALIMDPIGQTIHALCVTDCLIHTKSALDSMAVFLTSLLNLDVKGGNRDFKKLRFRQLIAEKDPMLGQIIKKLKHWLEQLREIRDEWIHRSSVRCLLTHGPSKVGVLPIPKKVTLSFYEQTKVARTERNFWSTKDFVEYHYSNLLTLFLAIVERSIQIEQRDLLEPVLVPADAEKGLTMFPILVTEKMTFEKMKVKLSKSMVDW